ncbi:MAG: toast rack family protein [Anaerolineales bacterium]
MRIKRFQHGALILGLALLILACAVPIPTTEPLTVIEPVDEVQTVDMDGAERAEVRLRMLADTLNVQPAEDVGLLRAHFHYNVAEWEPTIKQETEEQRTRVTINQGLGSQIQLGKSDEYLNTWDIGLRRHVPLDLGVDLGRGELQMALGGLSLTRLGITTGGADLSLSFNAPNPETMSTLRITAGTGKCVASDLGNANFDRLNITGGAGNIDLDFGGTWQRSALADIKAGAGRITLRAPADLGVRVTFASTPLNTTDITGFTQQDDNVYVNAAYGQSPLTLTINLTTGVGALTLISQ